MNADFDLFFAEDFFLEFIVKMDCSFVHCVEVKWKQFFKSLFPIFNYYPLKMGLFL